MRLQLYFIGGVGFFLMMPAAGEIYKCRNYDGDISYSEEPCPKNATAWGIKITQPEPKPKANKKNKESILEALYSKEIFTTNIKTMGRCSGFYFKYPHHFSEEEQELRLSAISALRKISGYYEVSEEAFSQTHNSSMLDTVDVELGQVELTMMKMNCKKQSRQILEFAKPERFIRPQQE